VPLEEKAGNQGLIEPPCCQILEPFGTLAFIIFHPLFKVDDTVSNSSVKD
jgi:hypothetical protein